MVAGVREDGYRDILGARVTEFDNELFWSGLFEKLKERGVIGVQLIVSDRHTGIQKAGGDRLPQHILANVPGLLHPRGLEESPPETSEGGCRGAERGLRK